MPVDCPHKKAKPLFFRGPSSLGSRWIKDARRCLVCRRLLELEDRGES
jgi:hypothetical protein